MLAVKASRPAATITPPISRTYGGITSIDCSIWTVLMVGVVVTDMVIVDDVDVDVVDLKAEKSRNN